MAKIKLDPPPGHEVAWLATKHGKSLIVYSKLWFDAKKEAELKFGAGARVERA